VTWEIRVWHENVDDRTRLCIEAGQDVPDEVIGSVAGSYWFEEVQFAGEEWDEEGGPDDPEGLGHFHG
jgi:hypothetical protein